MFQYIKREVQRIKDYPTAVIDFMMEEKNWVEVDPDCALGNWQILSYPEHIFVLNLDNAVGDVAAFFDQFPNEKLHQTIIEESALDENLLNHDLDEFTEDDLNINCVFAYVYPYYEEDDIINEDKFEDHNHVFIYNGLMEDEDYEPEEFAEKALNVSDFELF